jgi:hypothetical protein
VNAERRSQHNISPHKTISSSTYHHHANCIGAFKQTQQQHNDSSMPDEETPLKSTIARDDDEDSRDYAPLSQRIRDVVQMYWSLGFIAFGGPTAHIAIFQDHMCRVHDWIAEDQFLELFALSQGLPGPTSTQLLIGTAATHGGMLGGSIAFMMWSLPGFVVVTFASLLLYNVIDASKPPV